MAGQDVKVNPGDTTRAADGDRRRVARRAGSVSVATEPVDAKGSAELDIPWAGEFAANMSESLFEVLQAASHRPAAATTIVRAIPLRMTVPVGSAWYRDTSVKLGEVG